MSTRKSLFYLTLSVLACMPTLTFGQVENWWNGNGATANWSESANWDLPPLTDLDTVVFPVGPTNNPVNTNDTTLNLSGVRLQDAYEIWGNTLLMSSNAPFSATKDAIIHADVSYPDPVDDAADWNVSTGATLSINGNINAPAQGNTNSGSGITGYAKKTGNGTLRLTGADNRLDSGLNLRSGTTVLDGATLFVTNQYIRLSAGGTNGEARLVVTNNANVTIGYADISSNAKLDFGFSEPTVTNYLDMESGNLTLLGRGFLSLCNTTNDVAVVNHNGGTIESLRDNGPGVQLISSASGGLRAEYNLNGGTLKTKVVTKNSSAPTGDAILNFNGGTLFKNISGGNSVNNSFLKGLDEVNILDGGAIIDIGSNGAVITNQLAGVGSGGLTKRGSALLQFRGVMVTNTFDGPVVVEEGDFEIRHQWHLGDNTNTVTVASNAVLYANFAAEPNPEWYVDLVMEGGSTLKTKSGARPAAGFTVNGPFTYNANGFSSILGSITSGASDAALIKSGTGNLQFTGAQTYSLPGSNVVAQGKLRLSGSPVTLGSLNVLSGTQNELEMAGSINGAITVEAGAIWRPGFGSSVLGEGNIQTVNHNGNLTIESGDDGFGFYATTDLQIDSGAWTNVDPDNLEVVASDSVIGLTTATYGGDLWVTDVATVPALAAGQVYKLFDAATYAGVFEFEFGALASAPGPNLAWDTSQLAVDGTLRVVSTLPAPTPEPLMIDVQGGTNMVVTWTDPAWHLEAQNNPIDVGLSTNWYYYPGTSGVVIPMTSTNVETFFLRLAYP